MELFDYCSYRFRGHAGLIHVLSVQVTPSLSLEWTLYVNNELVGSLLDDITNILLPERLDKALSYRNVLRIYNELLIGPPING